MIRTTAYQERLDALSTGAEGERLAAEYLLKEGFDLLHRNWRNGRCEIDLVARRDGVLHIIEVKSRAADVHLRRKAMTAAKFGRGSCIATCGLNNGVQFDFKWLNSTRYATYRMRWHRGGKLYAGAFGKPLTTRIPPFGNLLCEREIYLKNLRWNSSM